MKIAQILISDSWGAVSPETIEKGLGGRETAMLSLAREWAKAGAEVTNFVNTDKAARFYEPFGNRDENGIGEMTTGYHEYLPINTTKTILSNLPHDVLVTWESPSILSDDSIRNNVKLKICEMQVAHFANNQREAAEEYCDYVAALSPWAAEFLQHQGYSGKTVIFPNGIALDRYKAITEPKKLGDKAYPRFVYSSSPDRGLWPLLKMWPEVRKELPGAQLYVAYGVEKLMNHLKWTHTRQGEMALEVLDLMKQPGVVDCGKIGQKDLAELQMSATGFLYPCDAIAPTETACISVIENAAAGNPLILSDNDCLETEYSEISAILPLPFKVEEWMSAIQAIFTDSDLYESLSASGIEFAKKRDWSLIAKDWLTFFNQELL